MSPMRLLATVAVLALLVGTAGAQTVSLPEGHDLSSPDRGPFTLSPDGRTLVYLARATLFSKPVTGGDAAVVRGPLQGRTKSNPLFAPDGQSLVYWATDDSVLQRVPLAGGTPVTLAKVENPLGLSWSADGQILVGQGEKGILRVPATGGAAQVVVMLPAGEAARMPQLLPDGDTVLFTLGRGTPIDWAQPQIVAQSIKTGTRTVVAPGRDASYLPSGHLVYASGTSLVGVSFDSRTLTITSDPVTLAERIPIISGTGAAQYSVAANGTLAYVGMGAAPVQLAFVGLDGTRMPLGEVPAGTGAPRIAANGKKVTFAAAGTIYVADIDNVAAARKVIENATFPLLSPDAEWLAFGSLGTRRSTGEEVIFMQKADGSGEAEMVARPARAPEHWMEGDQGFSFITHRGGANNYDLWYYAPQKKEVEPIVVSVDDSGQLSSSTSPDRKWVAYISSETGEWQTYVQPYPANGKKYRMTSTGGRSPMWTSANQLVFDKDGQMYTVSMQVTGETPTFGTAKELPITGYIQPMLRRNWDLKRDGDKSQFLMLFRAGPQLTLVPAGWTSRVQARGR